MSQAENPTIDELQAEIRRLRGELAMSHNAVGLLLMEVETMRERSEVLAREAPLQKLATR
jgi:hypothetical protein